MKEWWSLLPRVIWNARCQSTTTTSFRGVTSSCPRIVPEHPRGQDPGRDPDPGPDPGPGTRRRAAADRAQGLDPGLGLVPGPDPGVGPVARDAGPADPSPGIEVDPSHPQDPAQGPDPGAGTRTRNVVTQRARKETKSLPRRAQKGTGLGPGPRAVTVGPKVAIETTRRGPRVDPVAGRDPSLVPDPGVRNAIPKRMMTGVTRMRETSWTMRQTHRQRILI